jgi:cation diffusion facilitator family transporter
LFNPQPLINLGAIAAAAIIGFAGNELVALMQIRVGRQIGSDAMVADGQHARADGLTSLAVLIAVVGTLIGLPILDPLVGLLIGVTIVGITWNAVKAVWYRLLDAVDPQYIDRAAAVIDEHEEVDSVERLQLRWVGHRLHGEIVVRLNAALPSPQRDEFTDHIIHHLEHVLPNMGQMTVQVKAG